MYLPKIYERFSSKFPEVFKNFQQLGMTCRESGPLEKKYQDLTNLGVAIGANDPCGFIITDNHRFSEHDCGHGLGG